jgi:hypothetical protein
VTRPMAYMVENCNAVARGQEGFWGGVSGSCGVYGWRRAGTARMEIADMPPVKGVWFSMWFEEWA